MNNLYQRLRLSGYIMINTVFTLISIAEPIWSWNGYSSSWCLSPNECLDFEENGSLSELTLHSLPMLSQSTEPYTGKKKKKNKLRYPDHSLSQPVINTKEHWKVIGLTKKAIRKKICIVISTESNTFSIPLGSPYSHIFVQVESTTT